MLVSVEQSDAERMLQIGDRPRQLTLDAAVSASLARIAWAQTYPVRLVRIIVGFAPGGPGDVLARTIGQSLQERLGQPDILVVHPSVPARTVPELIAYAKANPGKLNMASADSGTPPHVTGELFKMLAGTDMVHVPYRGGAPAITDLLTGQVQVYF